MLDQQLQSSSWSVGKAIEKRRDRSAGLSAPPGSHLAKAASHEILPARFRAETPMRRRTPSMAQGTATRISRRPVAPQNGDATHELAVNDARSSAGFADPVFILALPRSFSSVVCGMLGQHPQMYGLPERSEEHTSELQSHSDLVCRLLLEKKKKTEQQRRAKREPLDDVHMHALLLRPHQGVAERGRAVAEGGARYQV